MVLLKDGVCTFVQIIYYRRRFMMMEILNALLQFAEVDGRYSTLTQMLLPFRVELIHVSEQLLRKYSFEES
jgi:hypothetical protein